MLSLNRHFREYPAPLIATGTVFDMADILDRERELGRWSVEMAVCEETFAGRGDLLNINIKARSIAREPPTSQRCFVAEQVHIVAVSSGRFVVLAFGSRLDGVGL
jgi:hypothetical protein